MRRVHGQSLCRQDLVGAPSKIAWLWLKNETAQVDFTTTSSQARRLGIGNAYVLHSSLGSRCLDTTVKESSL